MAVSGGSIMMPAESSLPQAAPRLAEPHKRLMAAVLQTVVDDCRGTAYARAAGYAMTSDTPGSRQAVAYVASTDRAWPFSFENLCESLGLDVDCLRRRLQ